uniref:Uncharacterized protein n=1 Tax=Anguilla anguilla TaxID=7936 RepID=A0A0E9XIU4_ANGAN
MTWFHHHFSLKKRKSSLLIRTFQGLRKTLHANCDSLMPQAGHWGKK